MARTRRNPVNRRIRLLLAVPRARLRRAARPGGVAAGRAGRLALAARREAAPRRPSSCPRRAARSSTGPASQLAIGEQATTVYADPRQVRDPRASSRPPRHERSASTPTRSYEQLVEPEAQLRLRRAQGRSREGGAAREAQPRRASASIPRSGASTRRARSPSHILGYAGLDNRGLAGLELQLDKTLAGTPGQRDAGDRRARSRARRRRRSGPAVDGRERAPDDRPHDPGERRGGAAADDLEVAREGRDRGRARPAERRRARDGERAGLRRERTSARRRRRSRATAR